MSDRAGSPAMKAEELLEQAAGVVARRRSTYGQPIELFEQVARRWSLVLGVEVTAAQAILCLIDLKVARLAHDLRHLDSITDIAGYAGCLAEVGQMMGPAGYRSCLARSHGRTSSTDDDLLAMRGQRGASRA